MGQGKGGCVLTHLVIPIQVLVQNLYNAPPALNPDPRACLAALQIIEPGLKFIHSHVYLLIKECNYLCISFGHSEMKERTDGC